MIMQECTLRADLFPYETDPAQRSCTASLVLQPAMYRRHVEVRTQTKRMQYYGQQDRSNPAPPKRLYPHSSAEAGR